MYKESVYRVTYIDGDGVMRHANPKYIKNVRKLLSTKDVIGVWREVETTNKFLTETIYRKGDGNVDILTELLTFNVNYV